MADPYGYAGAGDSIADGLGNALKLILKANKEKDSYEQALSRIDQLSKFGTKGGQIVQIDPNVKDKDIIPFTNQKAIDDIKNSKTLSRAQKMGEIKAYSEMAGINLRQQLTQAAKEPKTPTTIDGQTYNLTEAQRLQAAQNAAAAKRAEASGGRAERTTQLQEQAAAGTQPQQKRRFDLADAKEQRAILEKQPEYQFMNKHGITPAKIMENPFEDYTLYGTDPQGKQAALAWNITRDPKGNLIGQGMHPETPIRTSGIVPPGYPNKKVPGTWGDKDVPYTQEEVKAYQQQFYYHPNSPIYRVRKNEFSKTSGDDPKVNVKGKATTIDPEGDIMSVHGQLMPINEFETIKQRALTMKNSYLNKITYDPNSGETLDDYNKRVAGLNQYMMQLGYDPQQFLKQ